MAIFNFIAGGYYGKLGETVGQRWRDERIVRAYTKPRNPQSEEQTENRRLFSTSSKAVNIAMQMNGGDKKWASNAISEQNRRFEAARQKLKETNDFMQIIPLLPYGTLADVEVSNEVEINGSTITYHAHTETDLANVPIAVLVEAKNLETEEKDFFVRRGRIGGVPNDWTFDITIPTTHALDETCMTTAVSYDEGETENPIVYLAPQTIVENIQTIYIRIASVAVTHDASGNAIVTVTLDENVDVPVGAQAMLISGDYEKQGETKHFSLTENVLPSGNSFSFTIPADNDGHNQPLRFSATNEISFDGAEWTGATKIFIMESQVETVATDDKRSAVYDLDVPSTPTVSATAAEWTFASTIAFTSQNFQIATTDMFWNANEINFNVDAPSLYASGNKISIGAAGKPINNYAFGNGEVTVTNAVVLSATAHGLDYRVNVANMKFTGIPQEVNAWGVVTQATAFVFEEDEDTASYPWGFKEEEDAFPTNTYTFDLSLATLQSLRFYGEGVIIYNGELQSASVAITELEWINWIGGEKIMYPHFKRNDGHTELEEYEYAYWKPSSGRIPMKVTHNISGKSMTLNLERVPDNRYW